MRKWLAWSLGILLAGACSGDETVLGPGSPTETDADQDGWNDQDDCDDNDPKAHPGRDEVCDGTDNDCNGVIDDEAVDATTSYADADSDGFGNADDSQRNCQPPEDHVLEAGDCDDSDPLVYPGASERCNGADDDCDKAIDEDIPTDGMGCQDPGLPTFPQTIDTLTITTLTGTNTNDKTDDNDLWVCLSATDCWKIDLADVNDFELGDTSVFHFEGLNLPRSQVDRIQIITYDGPDRWVPACLEVQFDGEPVYCNPTMGQPFGTDAGDGDIANWTDPDFLHNDCVSCFPSALSHGPMVGAVGPDTAKLWARSDATRQLAFRVSKTADVTASTPVSYLYPSPATDYATVADIQGLEPDSRYFYTVEVEGEQSAVHSFTTAPARDESSSFRFAFGSCSKDDPQSIFGFIESLEPDLFLFVGDNHYANSNDLGSLRWYYRWSLEHLARASLARTTPTIAVWDDHDYTDNNEDGYALGKEVALRAFTEYWANPGFGQPPTTPGVFFRYDYGDVSFFMLDDRYYRGIGGTLLGAGQTQWLIDELVASTATFKFLVSGSQFTLHGSGDSWAVFPDAQDALFDLVRDQGIDGVIAVSGDVHYSEIRLLERSNQGGYDIPELTSSPLAHSRSNCGSTDSERLYCFDDSNSFVMVDVDTTSADPTVKAQIMDSGGQSEFSYTIKLSDISM